jgi:hypothetical protein
LGYASCDNAAGVPVGTTTEDDNNGCETNLQTDLTNCGACGRVCPNRANATRTCVGGQCVYTCDVGFANCDNLSAPGTTTEGDNNGCETDITTVTNCGACGHTCPQRANASRVCTAGQCVYTCDLGYASCDNAAGVPVGTTTEGDANGCETNLNTNANNCGACGTVCPNRANATRNCVGGQCVYTCNLGYASCDNAAGVPVGTTTEGDANGCETNLNTNANNCGACGKRCATGASCTAGECVCPLNQTVCGATATSPGTCRNLQTDVQNCGSCGRVCNANQGRTATCTSGGCGCSGPGSGSRVGTGATCTGNGGCCSNNCTGNQANPGVCT